MEDWPAFLGSFSAFVELLQKLGAKSRPDAPATISVLAGDIHFSFAAEIRFPAESDMVTRVHQLVSSPIRNALKPPESTAMRLGTSRFALLVGRFLRRAAGRRRTRVLWKMDRGPTFANCLSQLFFVGRSAELVVLQARPHDDDAQPTLDRVIEVDLVAGASSKV